MKLLHSNGQVMQVYNIEGPVYTVRAFAHGAIKYNGYHILQDDEARAILRELLELGYEGERLDGDR